MKQNLSSFLVCLLFAGQLVADEKLFPTDAGFLNVKDPPYNAKGDGVTDDTVAIQSAITFSLNRPNNYSAMQFVYFPAGTYVVSNTLESRIATNGWSYGWRAGLQLIGQSDTGTVIRLKDQAPGFGDPGNPKAVLRTGSEDPGNPDGSGNQAFRHSIYHLTIDTGAGNPGAVGLDYLASNRGAVEDVTIRSGDGEGFCGLSMMRQWPGPALIKRVRIEGFQSGVMVQHYEYSMTFEHLTLIGQKKQGIYVRNNVLNIRDLVSSNTVPGIVTAGGNNLVTLLDGHFTGGGSSNAAIVNQGKLYLRNITSSGYGMIVDTVPGEGLDVPGGETATHLAEYVSHPAESLFPSPPRALHLPVLETPEYHTNDLSQWANVVSFGATTSKDSDDDAPGIQTAIDSGKPIVYLPRGSYTVSQPIILRGAVRKFTGMHSFIGTNANYRGGSLIRFAGGSADICILEQLRLRGWVEQNSAKTLVLRYLHIEKGYCNTPTGTGDVFLEDLLVRPVLVNYPQRLWARQLDDEGAGPPLVENHGGVVWIMGMKTEKHATAIKTVGGYTELLGGLFYPLNDVPAAIPLFINEGGSVSYSYAVSANPYAVQVRETRDGVTRELSRASVPSRGNGSNVPLYVGYHNELRLQEPRRDDPGHFSFEVIALPGTVYAIDVTTDFLQWQPLITNTATGLRWVCAHTGIETAAGCFYRARQLSP